MGEHRAGLTLRQRLQSLANHMARDINVSEHRHWLTTWEKCFVGTDAVEWMLAQAVVESEAAALELGNLMLNA
eukprot:CAMPEP_0198202256 /NCGR_PEP_ID=MMETSP1445-20131203/5377_1 /TAXON_ID=36898 /ORGANISM="Pyramimonas sp., Strain CCMP2087" /LENGTH=72 /DNA_ID=CAMNT_0043873071 /DNA_START=327 /DNA_END=541 /DNA_ORIENTATION=-